MVVRTGSSLHRVREERQARDVWQELGLMMSDDPFGGTISGGVAVDTGGDSHSDSPASQEKAGAEWFEFSWG